MFQLKALDPAHYRENSPPEATGKSDKTYRVIYAQPCEKPKGVA
jgi:hypothetical protein